MRAARLEAVWRTWLWAQDGVLPQHAVEPADLPGMPIEQVVLEEIMQEWDLPTEEEDAEQKRTSSASEPQLQQRSQ